MTTGDQYQRKKTDDLGASPHGRKVPPISFTFLPPTPALPSDEGRAGWAAGAVVSGRERFGLVDIKLAVRHRPWKLQLFSKAPRDAPRRHERAVGAPPRPRV